MKDKTKRLKIAAVCYFLGSVGAYLGAAIGFFCDGSMAIVDLILGSFLLCLGSATLHRMNEEKED